MISKRFFKTVDNCEVSFTVEPEGAERVDLIIESNNWVPIPMAKLKSGPFKTRLRLPLNERFQFRYRVDGERWINDEAADDYVANEYGEENGVVDTTPEAA